MKNYEENPANLRNPQPGEVPTEGEMEMISEFLTDEQMKLMVVGAQLELEASSSGVLTQPENGKIEEISNLLDEGKSPMEVARELGVTLAKVREVKVREVKPIPEE